MTLITLHPVFSQDSAFQRTSSGLLYKIYSDKKEDPVRVGDYLKYHLLETLHDSVLVSTYENMPVYMRVDSLHNKYSPADILPLLRKGDGALVVMPAPDIQRYMGGQLPGFLRITDTIFATFKVLDLFRGGQGLEADSALEVARQREREAQTIESYLGLHNISTEKTAMGSYV